MKDSEIPRKTISGIIAVGATASAGFLSFAGMLLINPSLVLCFGALALAVIYEGQIFNEGISSALRRIFDKNYLKKGIAREYLEEQIKLEQERILLLPPGLEHDHEREWNPYLAVYQAQRKYLAALSLNHHLTKEQKEKKFLTERRLARMELNLIELIDTGDAHPIRSRQRYIKEVIGENNDRLSKELTRKKWLIRISSIFALGGGISSGFAAYSAIQAALVSCAALSAIPGGILLVAAVFAALGYTFMFYQAMTDIVQNYNGQWKKYFARRVDESSTHLFARRIGCACVVGLGIFATIATAGTWWYATRQGALLLKMGDFAANVIRNVSVPALAFSTLMFNVSNAVSSVDKFSRTKFGELAVSSKEIINAFINELKTAWREKKSDLGVLLNPFKFIGNLIAITTEGLFFLGHFLSMGVISDRLDGVNPMVSAALTAANEGAVDANYLPNEETEHHHSHSPVLLKVCLFPVKVVAVSFKMLGIGWDSIFTLSPRESYARTFPKPAASTWVEPEVPSEVAVWYNSNTRIANRIGVAIPPSDLTRTRSANDGAAPLSATGVTQDFSPSSVVSSTVSMQDSPASSGSDTPTRQRRSTA
jgi:hypothetical protein